MTKKSDFKKLPCKNYSAWFNKLTDADEFDCMEIIKKYSINEIYRDFRWCLQNVENFNTLENQEIYKKMVS